MTTAWIIYKIERGEFKVEVASRLRINSNLKK